MIIVLFVADVALDTVEEELLSMVQKVVVFWMLPNSKHDEWAVLTNIIHHGGGEIMYRMERGERKERKK